jgi:adenosylcobinamide-phosphate synthase
MTTAVAAVAGLVADRLVGEPPAAWHPVARYGQAMAALERRWYREERIAGLHYALVGVGSAALAGLVLRRLLGRQAATALATWIAVGGRMLGEVAESMEAQLAAGDLTAARATLPALVGRDPTDLDEGEIARAVVESVAENTADAVVAPVLFAAFGGAPAVLAYRAVNTLDAMVGHRSERYRKFGWASARLDDLANVIPARVAAAAVALAAPKRARAVLTIVRQDAPAHPSPNAGVIEAAFAAALDLRLGGTNRYGEQVEERATLGDGRPATAADIGRAVRLARRAVDVVALGMLAAGIVRFGRAARRGR